MKGKIRVLIAITAALIIILPMAVTMPNNIEEVFLLVGPVAFVAFFELLGVMMISDRRYRVRAYIVLFIIFAVHFFYTFSIQEYSFYKALSYCMVSLSLAAVTILSLAYILDVDKK